MSGSGGNPANGYAAELPGGARNEAKATVTSFGFSALAEAGTVPVELSEFSIE